MIMSLLLALPDDPLQLIAAFLSPTEITNLLCCSQNLYRRFNGSDLFWTRLLREQFPEKCIEHICSVIKHPKEAFWAQAGARDLSTVKWVRLQDGNTWPSDREGHLCARIGNSIVITGGYSEDDAVYIFDLLTNGGDSSKAFVCITPSADDVLETSISPAILLHQGIVYQVGNEPLFVYGASLTAIDCKRAVRFGGFRSGGYSHATSQVVLLHLNGTSASWQVVSCTLQSGRNPMHPDWVLRASRAYHTATLLFDRYLLILGGMQDNGSIWEPLVLDTLTWTWMDQDIPHVVTRTLHPSSRHGHSVVVDSTRNRILLFGGGDGSDLLRSGKDNTEVWECPLPLQENELGDYIGTMWNCIHEDQMVSLIGEVTEERPDSMDVDTWNDPRCLTPVEALCLGRCHSSFRISRDKVVLLFGSGRPSTNGLLGYDLINDVFCRPKIVGSLPIPRFTFASVFLEEYGCIFAHGGFSVQHGSSIVDGCLLDLAGGCDRNCPVMAENMTARSYAALTNEDALEMASHSPSTRLDVRTAALLQYLQSLGQGEHDDSGDDESDDSDFEPPT